MIVEFIERDQIWQEETTRYWFRVEGIDYGVADQGGHLTLLDSEGWPILPDNDHDRILDTLLPHYEAAQKEGRE